MHCYIVFLLSFFRIEDVIFIEMCLFNVYEFSLLCYRVGLDPIVWIRGCPWYCVHCCWDLHNNENKPTENRQPVQEKHQALVMGVRKHISGVYHNNS